MSQRIAVSAAFAALAWAGALGAHHSESMFETLPIWVEGSYVEFARINPHSIVTLEETAADGQVRRWAIEGGSIPQLDRRGIGPDFLNAGDVVEYCAFPMKERFMTSRPEGAPPFVHGQVVVMPDGKMQIWGSYGKLKNCVRPDDRSRVWVDFLDSNELARAAWCRRFVGTSTREDTKALVAEIDALMANPCD